MASGHGETPHVGHLSGGGGDRDELDASATTREGALFDKTMRLGPRLGRISLNINSIRTISFSTQPDARQRTRRVRPWHANSSFQRRRKGAAHSTVRPIRFIIRIHTRGHHFVPLDR